MPAGYYIRTPVKFEQITVSTTVKTLGTGHGGSNFAFVTCETNDVRWRDDGTDPTASVGQLLKAGQTLGYDGQPEDLRFIRVSADATLDVTSYS